MRSLNRHQITLYGTQELLDWIKSVRPDLHRWDLEFLNHRPSAYLIETEDQNCHGLALGNYYKAIIEQELSQHLYIRKELWPAEITLDLFHAWFSYQYHEEIYDLSPEELEAFDD